MHRITCRRRQRDINQINHRNIAISHHSQLCFTPYWFLRWYTFGSSSLSFFRSALRDFDLWFDVFTCMDSHIGTRSNSIFGDIWFYLFSFFFFLWLELDSWPVDWMHDIIIFVCRHAVTSQSEESTKMTSFRDRKCHKVAYEPSQSQIFFTYSQLCWRDRGDFIIGDKSNGWNKIWESGNEKL